MSFKTVVRFIQYLSLLLVLRSYGNIGFIKKNGHQILPDLVLRSHFCVLFFRDVIICCYFAVIIVVMCGKILFLDVGLVIL